MLADLLMGGLQQEGLKASADIAKQVITLSSGAVAFTVTFLDKFTAHGEGPIKGAPLSLYAAWALFSLAILFALWTLMAVTGTLLAFDKKTNGWTLTKDEQDAANGAGTNARIPALLMLLFFLLAIVGMIATGMCLVPG